MNKTYKTKWNEALQSWVACSEITPQKGRSGKQGLVAVALCALSPFVMADANWNGETFIGSVPAAFQSPTDTNTYNMIVNPSHTYIAASEGMPITFHRVSGNKTFNYRGDLTATGGLGLVGIQYNKTTVNFEDNVNYTASSAADTKGNGRAGIIASNDASTVNFKKNTVILSNYNFAAGTNLSGGVYQIGVLAGSSVNTGNDTANSGLYSSVVFNNLEMNLTDSSQGKGLFFNPVGTFGIRAIQGAHDSNTGTGSAGYVEVQGDLNLDISADRAVGIYVSGNRYNTGDADGTGKNGSLTPKVVLNNSTITLKQSTTDKDVSLTWDSHAIKLGKVRNTGEGSGILESHGALVIDTTGAKQGGGIKMLRNSKLLADDDSSSTNIKTNGYALEIGGHDDMNSSFRYEQAASHNVVAGFKNAVFTTTGTSADPLISGSQARKDLIFVDQGQVGTTVSFSGDKTDLTAHSDGYIINVSGNYTAPNYDFYSNTYDTGGVEGGHDAFEGSSVTFNATDAGSMTGLVSKGSVKTSEKQVLDSTQTPTLDVNLSNGFIWNLNKKGSETTALFDTATISSGAIINGAYDDAGGNDYTLQGNVISNGGIISLDNASHNQYNDILTIEGNYSGSNGAVVKMNTLWNAPGDENGTDSQSDVLNITGTADGSTTVMPIKSDGTANVIDGNVQQVASVLNTVPVINVGTSGATAFTGTAQTTGATEVQLAKRTNDQGQDEYYWTMAAKQPGSPTQPGNPSQPNTPIYANQIPGYVAMPRVNLEQGYATVGTLHERRGENQTLAWDECGTCGNDAKGQTWARLYGKHLEQDGKSRLNLDTDIFGVQIGHDFLVKRNDNGSHNLTGGYVAYNTADTDFADEYRAENGIISRDKYTGKGKFDALSLGLTNTYYSANGSYLDVVGQVSWLRNRYEARNGTNPDSQNGWGAALSAEVGRPFALGNHTPSEGGWMIEPQAQLVYQYVSLDDFNDGTRHVDQNGQDGLRGRVGVRLAYNAEGKEQQTNTFYTVANIWHDFLNPAAVDIGRDSLREKYASTWAEVGLGVQVPVAKHSYVYGDARYEQELGSTKREGYRGSVGFKYTWK